MWSARSKAKTVKLYGILHRKLQRGFRSMCGTRCCTQNVPAERTNQSQKRLIAFRDRAPYGGGSGMPCGACREFFYQLNAANADLEIMVDYAARETITLRELLPKWWEEERAAAAQND